MLAITNMQEWEVPLSPVPSSNLMSRDLVFRGIPNMIHLPNSTDDPELPLVPVYPAIVWVCPNCETENFARMVIAELTEEVSEQYGLKSVDERGYLTPPTAVECGHCGQQFETDSSFGGLDHMGDDE